MKEDIIRMAREAGFYKFDEYGDDLWICDLDELKRFFHMAQAAEREACAKRLEAVGCDHCAANIRLRGKE
jgi:hypothetical protein